MLPVAEVPSVFKECQNCGQQVLGSNFDLHEAHCVRHRRRCEYCRELMPIGDIEAHCVEQRGSIEVLATAMERGDAARVQLALDHDASKSALLWSDERGASLLHLAAAASRDRWDMQALVDQMVRLGADVAAVDQHGWTPLHAAARAGAAATVGVLLSAGASVHARAALGSTPLEVSTGEETRLALLSAGAELPGAIGSSRQSLSRSSSSRQSSVRGGMSSSHDASLVGSRQPSRDGIRSDDPTAVPLSAMDWVPHPPPPRHAPSCEGGDASACSVPGRVLPARGVPPRPPCACGESSMPTAAQLDEGLSDAFNRGATLTAGPRPASSSRHAQRLRAMVQAEIT